MGLCNCVHPSPHCPCHRGYDSYPPIWWNPPFKAVPLPYIVPPAPTTPRETLEEMLRRIIREELAKEKQDGSNAVNE